MFLELFEFVIYGEFLCNIDTMIKASIFKCIWILFFEKYPKYSTNFQYIMISNYSLEISQH